MGIFSNPEVVFLKESSDAKEYLQKLEGLLPNANGDVREKIQREIAITKAGIAGEDNIIFELKHSGMDLVVLHDLYIEVGDLGAQIDFYVITPKVNIVIECKNLVGNIEINSKGEFIRTFEYNGKRSKKGLYSPITQNERHMEVLKQCRREGFGFLMGAAFSATFESMNKSLIVLANSETIVNDRYAPKEIKEKVIRADQLIATIKKINSDVKLPSSSKKEMRGIGERMLARNVEVRKDYFKHFEDLMKEVKGQGTQQDGVTKKEEKSQKKVCPKCGKTLVRRVAVKGEHAGEKFYGCSGFPKCRYTEKIG